MKHEAEFDLSADMRLVELQRAALGIPAPAQPTWQSGLDSDGAGTVTPLETQLASALIVVEARATPASEVIPGAVVTMALSIANEGVAIAHDVRVNVPLPGFAEYRNGSFLRDGRLENDQAAAEFFDDGTLVSSIEPGSRATFVWKLSVRQGTAPLLLTPLVRAGDCAVIGAGAVTVSRRVGASTSFTHEIVRAEIDRPFFELDDEEQLIHEAADAALETSRVAAAPIDVEPSAPASVEPAEPVAPPREGVVLFGRLDRLSLQYFERVFGGTGSPTLLQHFMLAGALACTLDSEGSDNAGLQRHMEAQAQLLQRIVLHEKLGKKEPIAQYAGALEIQTDALRPTLLQPAALRPDARVARFECELSDPALAVLRKMREERARWDFTKARQLALALQAQHVIGCGNQFATAAADTALRAYSQVSGIQLQRFFVRMRIDRTTALLSSNDEALDRAARTLLAAFNKLFA